jgi:hypothetical protein
LFSVFVLSEDVLGQSLGGLEDHQVIHVRRSTRHLAAKASRTELNPPG